jgi:hypothetical protein
METDSGLFPDSIPILRRTGTDCNSNNLKEIIKMFIVPYIRSFRDTGDMPAGWCWVPCIQNCLYFKSIYNLLLLHYKKNNYFQVYPYYHCLKYQESDMQ